MKIVYVSDAVYPYNKGGKEKRLYELSTRLAKLGHEVHIYTMHWWNGPEMVRMEHGVQLHAICRLHPMYNGDKRSIKEGLLFGLACFKLFRVKFDVLDVDHMPFFPVYSTWLICRLRGRKLHGTWHEALSRKDWTDYMGPLGLVAAAIERVSIHLPHTITAASAHTQSLIRSEHKRTRRVAIVSSGVDVRQLSRIKPATIDCDVLYTGRLVKDKNIDTLVEAIALIAKQQPDVRCVIVGHGIEKQNLEQQIRDLGVEQQISLRGPLPKAKDVYAYMKAARVFCLPSVREGFGIVALEALGCGTPVVTTNAPANAAKDLIQEGVDGSIFDLDAHSLSKALNKWIARPKPNHIKGKAKGYDWGALARTQGEVYAL